MISVIKLGNLYIGLVGAVLGIIGLVHRFVIYIAGWASVVDVFSVNVCKWEAIRRVKTRGRQSRQVRLAPLPTAAIC